MNERVVITGLGPVTPLGDGVSAVWEALAAGRTHVVERELRIDLADYVRMYLSPMPAEWHLVESRDPTVLITEDCAEYRDVRYAIRAMRLAIEDSGLDLDRENNAIGAIYAFEAPGMEVVISRLLSMPPEAMMVEHPQLYPRLSHSFYHTHSFFYVHVLGKAVGLHGFSTCIHNACSSGAYALETAAQCIRAGHAPAMLVAGAEAFETGVRLQYLHQMETYAAGPVMRVFDRNSSGFYVGEGGAALMLESLSHAQARGARIYAEYLGGAFAQQSWKHALPDVRNGRLSWAVKEALRRSGTAAEEIDLVIPHGAGSAISDGYELEALRGALGGAGRAPLCPLKPYVGHQLGNCVIIELVLGLLMMQSGTVVGQRNGSASEPNDLPLPIARQNEQREIRRLLKIATGFTGHDAAMVFARQGT